MSVLNPSAVKMLVVYFGEFVAVCIRFFKSLDLLGLTNPETRIKAELTRTTERFRKISPSLEKNA